MASLIHQPMDKLFKKFMEEPPMLREFLTTHLPPKLLKKIDLNTLRLENNSFIDEALRAREADVLYSVNMGKRFAYLYILCEQQSEVDHDIAYRLLVYTVRIMETHRKRFPKKPLPLVYPLVVYSGDQVWDAPRDIFSLFGEEEALAREYLFKPYPLWDIHRNSDETLHQLNWPGLVAFALKHCKASRDFDRFLDRLLPWLRMLTDQDATSASFAKSVLHYVVDSVTADNEKIFIQKVQEHLSPELGDEAMTLAERFQEIGREQGITQGIERGITQGMQQGVIEGERKVLLRQLEQKFGEVPTQYLKRIENADANALLKLSIILIEAKSPEEIFE